MTLYNFSHFVQVWLLPPGFLILLVLAAFLVPWRQGVFCKVLPVMAFVLFWMFSTPVIVQPLIDGLQTQFEPLNLTMLQKKIGKSAIVVLGAGVDKAREFPAHYALSALTFERLHYAVYLNSVSGLPLIVSGGNKGSSTETEASLMRKTLQESYHLTSQAEENKSRDTEEESHFVLPILKKNQVHQIYLITHAWHMPRSMLVFSDTFKYAHIRIIPAPTRYISLLSDEPVANYMPSMKAFNTCAYALHEYIGMIWYHFKKSITETNLG